MSTISILDRYERQMRASGRSARTIRQRLRMAEKVLALWPDPNDATTDELIDWLGGPGRDWKPATRATYYSDVRRFFQWLSDAEVIASDPTNSRLFERPKVGQRTPKALTPDQEAAALAAARGNVRAWLLLALRSGLRAHEIAKIRGEDVQEDYIFVGGKGDVQAYIPTHPDLWALAQKYPRTGWWFPSPEHDGHVSADSVTILVGRLFRKVGIPSGSIHRCRHTYATTLLRRGADLKRVQQLMRHRSLATTEGYLSVTDDELRAAINLLGDTA